MTRRRHIITAVLVVVGIGLVATGAYFGFRYVRWRGIRSRVRDARRALEALADPQIRRDLAAHADYLGGRIGKTWLQKNRKDFHLTALHAESLALLRAAQGEVSAPHLTPGHHVIVTVSAIDDAELPTSVQVPPGWDGKAPLPLVLNFHGGGVRTLHQCFPAPAYPGVLVAEPVARGCHDYKGVQMTAVDECVADVRARYPVSRVFAMGMSMGGLATWFYGQRNIGEVSGLSPWAANADPAVWAELWEDEVPIRSEAGKVCEQVQDARCPVARVGQLACRPDLPIWIGHGEKDTVVPIGHGSSMYEKLQALGVETLRFQRFPDHGHGIPQMRAERLAWMLANGSDRGAAPIVGVIPPYTFVSDVAGAPPHRVIDPRLPARIVLRGGKIETAENAEAVKGGGKWQYPGPAGFAFERPFAIALPAEPVDHLARCAEELTALWQRRFGGIPRRTFPEDGAPEGVDTLIAFGTPEENPAVRDALLGMDVRVEKGWARLFGQEFEGEDIGVILVVPAGEGRTTATLAVWGSTPESYGQLWWRFGHSVNWEGDRGRWWFDYAVFDRRTCGRDTFLAVGFFDGRWQFDERLLFRGSDAHRKTIPGSQWALTELPPTDGGVWLSSLAPEEVQCKRGPVAFDRSAGFDEGALMIQGQRFEHGVGMTPPTTARWRIDGRYATFTATVGLQQTDPDSEIRFKAERVRFEVWGDGEKLAESPILDAVGGVHKMAADVSGVEILTLRAANTTGHVWHYGPVGWGNAALAVR